MSENVQSTSEVGINSSLRVMKRLHELYIASADEKSDAERISEGMSSLIIGSITQKALTTLIESESIRLRASATSEQWDEKRLAEEIASMTQQVTAEIFREHWFESTLSKPDHPIHAATYGTSMFRYDIRMLMAENPSAERFNEFAWIMFDANGLRSFKDCTSHEETTHYLQLVVRILVNEESPARKRLSEKGISVIPMATGGDEFVLYLRGKTSISQSDIDQTIVMIQQEISNNPELQSLLDFTSESVRKKFGMPSSALRHAFDLMTDDEKAKKLQQIGETLPDVFIPSFSGGGALVTDGIQRAIEMDDHDLQGHEETFSSLREKIVQATLEVAEERQGKNKKRGLETLKKTDPKTVAFRQRNNENRRLLAQNAELERLLEETRTQLLQLLGGTEVITEPQAQTSLES